MNQFLNNIQIPLAGLLLACAALGNLVVSYGAVYRIILASISFFFAFLLVLKVLAIPPSLREWFNQPVTAGVLPTFFMGSMILATYIKPFHYSTAYTLWLTALVLHAVYILLFTLKYIRGFKISNIYTSFFIVYVGIVVGSVTAPAFQMIPLGQALFKFGLLANLVLFPIIVYRYVVIKGVPGVVRPTAAIFAAPTSLCLAGYMQSFPVKSHFLVVLLTISALLIAVIVLCNMPRLLQVPFSPGYAAFTFPFVISAIAINASAGYLHAVSILWAGKFLTYWSVGIVLYVLIRFLLFLFPQSLLYRQKKYYNHTRF